MHRKLVFPPHLFMFWALSNHSCPFIKSKYFQFWPLLNQFMKEHFKPNLVMKSRQVEIFSHFNSFYCVFFGIFLGSIGKFSFDRWPSNIWNTGNGYLDAHIFGYSSSILAFKPFFQFGEYVVFGITSILCVAISIGILQKLPSFKERVHSQKEVGQINSG